MGTILQDVFGRKTMRNKGYHHESSWKHRNWSINHWFSSWWYICFDIQYQWQKAQIKHIRSKHCQWKKQWTSRTYKSISDKHLMKHIQTEGPSWKTWQTEHSWGSSSSIFICRRIEICHGQNMVCWYIGCGHLILNGIPQTMGIWWYMNPKNWGMIIRLWVKSVVALVFTATNGC